MNGHFWSALRILDYYCKRFGGNRRHPDPRPVLQSTEVARCPLSIRA